MNFLGKIVLWASRSKNGLSHENVQDYAQFSRRVLGFADGAEIIKGGDPRIGRQVILLPASQRRGEVVVGTLVEIWKYPNKDEVWTAETEGMRCHMASFLYRFVSEGGRG